MPVVSGNSRRSRFAGVCAGEADDPATAIFRPHLEDAGPFDAVLLERLIGVEHAGWIGRRLLRLPGLMRAAWQQWYWRCRQETGKEQFDD